MALTDTSIRKLRPADNPLKLGDSSRLYLLILSNGSKLWYMKYRIDGKEKKLAFGPYPDVSLLQARQRHVLKCVKVSIPPLTKKSHSRKRKTDRHSAR